MFSELELTSLSLGADSVRITDCVYRNDKKKERERREREREKTIFFYVV